MIHHQEQSGWLGCTRLLLTHIPAVLHRPRLRFLLVTITVHLSRDPWLVTRHVSHVYKWSATTQNPESWRHLMWVERERWGESLMILWLCIILHTCRFSPYYFLWLENMFSLFSDFRVLSLETYLMMNTGITNLVGVTKSISYSCSVLSERIAKLGRNKCVSLKASSLYACSQYYTAHCTGITAATHKTCQTLYFNWKKKLFGAMTFSVQ